MTSSGTLDAAAVDQLVGRRYSQLSPELCHADEAAVMALPRLHRARFRLIQAGVARIHLTDTELHGRVVAAGLADANAEDDLLTYLRLTNEHAIGLLVAGKVADALEPLVRVRWWAASLDDAKVRSMWTVASVNLASCLSSLGDYEGAHALNLEVYDKWGQDGKGMSYAGLLCNLVVNGCQAGHLDEVRPHGAALQKHVGDSSIGQLQILLMQSNANLALEDGAYEDALQYALQGLGTLNQIDPDDAFQLYRVAGRASLVLGRLDQAKRYAGLLLEAAEVFVEGVRLLQALELLGEIAVAEGAYEQLQGLLVRATSAGRSRSKTGLVPIFSRMATRLQERVSTQQAELIHTNQQLQLHISALALAKDKAESAAQARHGFLSSMSHEIRTPLHGVLGSTELLTDTPLTEEQGELVGMIRRSAGLTLSIVDDILNLRKLEEGQLVLDPVPFRLLQPAEDVVRSLEKMARDKGVDLRLTIDEGLPSKVVGDDRRLQQVLLNLTTNALKFTDDGAVELRIRSNDALVHFAVQDSGIGIPKERQAAIFDAYVQADASTARHSGGTGLGLPICQQLVSLMGGELRIRSSPGQGSTFYFEIPLDRCDGRSAPALPLKDLEGLTIVVADDNRINRLVIERMLQSLSAKPTMTASGTRALSLARELRPDVLLLDLHMPDLDGDAVCRELRATGYLGTVIALTASAMEEDRETCLAAGMDGYLTKPLTRESLARGIHSAAQNRSQQGAAA